MVAALLQRETLRLLTVGIDISSSTSHLLFARVLFQRLGSRATARFVPVERTVEWRGSRPGRRHRGRHPARRAGLIPQAYEPRELFVPEVLEEAVIEASRPRSAVS
jgi:hypothetical protein